MVYFLAETNRNIYRDVIYFSIQPTVYLEPKLVSKLLGKIENNCWGKLRIIKSECVEYTQLRSKLAEYS